MEGIISQNGTLGRKKSKTNPISVGLFRYHTVGRLFFLLSFLLFVAPAVYVTK